MHYLEPYVGGYLGGPVEITLPLETFLGNQGSNDFRSLAVGDWEAFHDLLWSTHWGFLEVSVGNDYILVGAGREKWRGKKW